MNVKNYKGTGSKKNQHSTVSYSWIRQEQQSKAICIMLPGLGYTTQLPLFYYATNVFVDHHIDVLHINYAYLQNKQFAELNNEEQDSWMYEDVQAVVKEVLKETQYQQYYVLSKSLGSIPMAFEWKQRQFLQPAYGIWLTPLLKNDAVYEGMLTGNLPSLCVIGDNDPHFTEERIQTLRTNSLIQTVIIPHAEHSLEIKGNVAASIQIVDQIMNNIKQFIEECTVQKPII